MVAMTISMNARCITTDTPMAMAVLLEGHPAAGTVTVTEAAVVLNRSSSTSLVSSLTVMTDTRYVAPEIRSVNRTMK